MWMLLALSAFGQHTTVSATIQDSASQPWAFGTYRISFFSNGLTGPFFLNGAPFNPGDPANTFAGSLNNLGAFSGVSVPSSNFITPVGTAWFVTVCPAATSACFTKTLPITGATMDLSSLVVPPALGVPANQYNQAAAYQDSEIKGPYLGFTYYNLTDSTLHVCTGVTACTWVSVGGGVGSGVSSLNGLTGALTIAAGTNITVVPSGGNTLTINSTGGGGGGSPAGTSGTIQSTDGAGNFTASNVNDNVQIPGALAVNESLDICGLNPWIDITCYGALAVSSVPTTTATTTATSANVTVASGTGFPNKSGISILGAGPTNVLLTPATPTATAVVVKVGMNTGDNAPGLTGATTSQYEIVGRGVGQGVTAASPTVTLTTGAATLGPVVTNITSISQTNNVYTVTTASASGAAAGGYVFLTGSTNATFSGPRLVATVVDATHFTYTGGDDTRNEVNPPAPATGGTVTVINANHLALPSSVVNVSGSAVTWVSGQTFNTGWAAGTWLAVNGICTTVSSVSSSTAMTIATSTACPTLPGSASNSVLTFAYQYYIYEFNGTNFAFAGISRPNETSWDDFGQAAPARPAWAPATAPSVATNDTLSTTIVSGGGTANLVLALAASQSVSGATAVHDDGPPLAAAYKAAATSPLSASLHIPTAATGSLYVINSYTQLIGGPVTNLQQSPILLNDTVATTHGLTWSGQFGGGSPACEGNFSWAVAQQIQIGTAYPGIASPSTSVVYDTLAFLPQHDNGLVMTVNGGGGFNINIHDSCFSRPGSTDTLGQFIVGYGVTNPSLTHNLFSINDVSAYGSIPTPTVFFRNDLPNSNGSGDANFESNLWIGRGYEIDSNPVTGSNSHYTFRNNYAQALRMPLVTVGALNNPTIELDSFSDDTVSIAMVAPLGTNQPTILIKNTPDLGTESTQLIAGQVSGTASTGMFVVGQETQVGQNTNLFRFRSDVFIGSLVPGVPAFSSLAYMDTMLRMGPGYSQFWPMASPAGLTTVLNTGGSIPVGNWNYEAVAYDATGRPTSVSVPSPTCAVVGGSQSCTEVIGTAPPWASSFSFYRSNGGGYGGVVACMNQTSLTCIDTANSNGGGPPPTVGTAGSVVITATGFTKPGWYDATQFTGSDFAVKINACVAAVNLNGGTCDSTGFAGPQAATHGIVAGCATGCKGLLILPTNGLWTFTLTGGTSPMLLRYPDFAVWGTSSTNNLVLKNASADGGALAGYIEMGEGLSGGDYGLSGGFQVAQSSTTSVGYAAQTIDSNTFKVNCLLESGQDATVSNNIGCFDASTVDTNNILVIPPTAAEKPCCTRTIINLVGNSLGTGPTVLEVYGSATVGSPNGVSFINPTMTHPKPGAYNIYLHDTNTTPTMAIDFGGATNFESATGNDQTTDEMLVDGAASVTIQNIVCAANNTGGNRTGNCIHVTTQNPNTQLFIGSAMSKSGAANWTYPMTMAADDNNPNSPLTLSAAGISKSYNTTQLVQNLTVGESVYVPAATSGNNIAIGTTNSAIGTNLLGIGASPNTIVFNSIGGALFPGALKYGTSLTANTAGSHENTTGSTNDITGQVTITNPATTQSFTFTTPYNSPPNCTISPTADTTAVGAYWWSSSVSAYTAHVHTTPGSTSTFSFTCKGLPN